MKANDTNSSKMYNKVRNYYLIEPCMHALLQTFFFQSHLGM